MSKEELRFTSAEKRPMVVAILLFVLTSVGIVAVNSYVLRGTLMPGWSISRYVGTETWSVIVFLLANMVVAGCVLKYLYCVGEKWKFWRAYFWVVVMMAVGLLGLSVCPIGYFDQPGQAMSVPSQVHGVCARMMFICMMIVAAVITFCQKASRATRMVAAVYVVYGIVCVLGHFTRAGWFLQRTLAFESCYLFGFLAFCLGMQGRKKIEEKVNE